MDIISKYNLLKTQAITARANRNSLVSSIQSNKQLLVDTQTDLDNTNKLRANLLGAIEIMKQLIEVLSKEQINQLRDLITYGLTTIFTDRNYAIDIVISESRNVKQATFFLVETLTDGTIIRSEFKDAIGGGVMSVVGLIIQVYYIIYYDLYPIIFMDEALSQISTQYIPNVLCFIDELAKKRHFKFVLISHDQRLIDYGNRVYKVVAGEVREVSKQ